MMKRFAVIDLGTNTFHILIAKASENGIFHPVHKERHYVYLGEGGIGHLKDKAIERGLIALEKFHSLLQDFDVTQYRITGTAALRQADNTDYFKQKLKEKFGFNLEIISGDREALYIAKGVSLVVPIFKSDSLIMDIGGGSVEFIFCKNGKIEQFQSFPLGVAVLFNKFHKTDPISQQEINVVLDHIKQVASEFFQTISHFPLTLVGASGTFDVIDEILGVPRDGMHCRFVQIDDVKQLIAKVLSSTLEERIAMPGIPENRAQLIVVAMLLIEYILNTCQVEEITASPFALKEGIFLEMLSKM